MTARTRRNFLGWTAGGLLGVGCPAALAGNDLPKPSDLFVNLRSGGFVICFRHGATTWSGVDRLEWPRAQQRLLSEEGINQSKLIGKSFRQFGIPVGEVLSSPFARCRDMAEIAFGRVEERMELVGLLSDEHGRKARIAYLARKVTELPKVGLNRIVISHTSNIAAVTGARLEEGEAIIVQPNIVGSPDILQTVKPGGWPN